jgi:predicted Zn-dependent protease
MGVPRCPYDAPVSSAPVPRHALLRFALLAVALVIAGWLALSLANERLQVSGIKLMAEQPPQPALALEKFRQASRLSASQQPELFEASAYYAQGQPQRAVTMLRDLLAQEPDNRTGWLLLSAWLRPTDPAGANAAAERARVLDGSF